MSGFVRIGAAGRFDRPVDLTIVGRRVRIWRDQAGDLRAREMVCRHQNGDLTQGECDGTIVVCPRHGWRYDLATGACLTESWAGLRPYDVREEDGEVWVSIRPRQSL